MNLHHDPLAQTEELNRPVVFSLSAHVMLLAIVFFWTLLEKPFRFGDPKGGEGGAVAVNIVSGIPLPATRTRDTNPVANPVQHEVPSVAETPKPVAPEPEPVVPDPKAVPIESEKKRRERELTASARKRMETLPENQLGSSTGARLSSPLLGGIQSAGGGGVGFGQGNPFGEGFGWYAEALQRRLAEEWRRTLGQASGGAAKPSIVTFRIQRNGAIDSIYLDSSSGNGTMDRSAMRAVQNVNPFQPLPPQLPKSSVVVQIQFQLN